jgi:hypothetical protein
MSQTHFQQGHFVLIPGYSSRDAAATERVGDILKQWILVLALKKEFQKDFPTGARQRIAQLGEHAFPFSVYTFPVLPRKE